MIRQITYQPKDSEKMETKWIFRDDGDLSKDYSDFKTMEVMLNRIYGVIDSYPVNITQVEKNVEEVFSEHGMKSYDDV